MNILGISCEISTKLGIDSGTLDTILRKNLTEEELNRTFSNNPKMIQLEELLNKDSNILEFEKKITSDDTKQKFDTLKNSLGKLQILVLINKLKKSKNCDEVLNSFMSVFNDKIELVNTILEETLEDNVKQEQKGGNNNYFIKYLKYKKKYILLKI